MAPRGDLGWLASLLPPLPSRELLPMNSCTRIFIHVGFWRNPAQDTRVRRSHLCHPRGLAAGAEGRLRGGHRPACPSSESGAGGSLGLSEVDRSPGHFHLLWLSAYEKDQDKEELSHRVTALWLICRAWSCQRRAGASRDGPSRVEAPAQALGCVPGALASSVACRQRV